MTGTAPETHKRFQNFTGISTIVCFLAIVSVFLLPSFGNRDTHQAYGQGMPLAVLLPHLLIIAAMCAGFRRMGDIVAFVVGLPLSFIAAGYGFLSGLGGTGMQGPDGSAFVIAIIQFLMAVAAAADLSYSRKLQHYPIHAGHRVTGLIVPAIGLVLTSLMIGRAASGAQDEVRSLEVDRELQAKFDRERWMNNPNLDDLVSLARCIESFRGDTIAGAAPKSLWALHQWSTAAQGAHSTCAVDLFKTRPASTLRDTGSRLRPLDTVPHPHWRNKHQNFYYVPPKNLRGDPYRSASITLGIEAVWDSAEFPNAAGQRGARSYLLDPNGAIHVTSEQRRATIADPLVPTCQQGDAEKRDHNECRQVFSPRERWGLVQAVPRFAIRAWGGNQVDSAFVELSFEQVNGLDSVRSVSIDWGDGTKPTLLDFRPSAAIGDEIIVRGSGRVHHFHPDVVHHWYRESRKTRVRAELVTRAGQNYHVEADAMFSNPAPAADR